MVEKVNNYEYFKIWWLFIEAAFAASKARNKELSKYDITMEQAGIMFCIKILGDNVTSAELGRQRGRERNTMSEALSTMVRKGLIVKTKDKINRNQLRISLTEKGHKIIEQNDTRESIKRVFSNFSAEELALMEKLCRKIHKNTLIFSEMDVDQKQPQKLIIDMI